VKGNRLAQAVAQAIRRPTNRHQPTRNMSRLLKRVCRWLGVWLLSVGCERPHTLYYVGYKRPLATLAPEQQTVIRQAYEDTGFSHNESEEGMCICLTEGSAINNCANKDGWYYEPLPIERCLPNEAADYMGAHHVSASVPYTPLAARVVNLNDPCQALRVSNEALRRASEKRRKQAVIDLLPGEPVPHFLTTKAERTQCRNGGD
jgi:hypothetical protein